MKSSFVFVYFFMLLSLSSCGGSASDKAKPSAKLFDASVAPITDGNWYQPAKNVSWQWQLTGVINTSHRQESYLLLYQNEVCGVQKPVTTAV